MLSTPGPVSHQLLQRDQRRHHREQAVDRRGQHQHAQPEHLQVRQLRGGHEQGQQRDRRHYPGAALDQLRAAGRILFVAGELLGACNVRAKADGALVTRVPVNDQVTELIIDYPDGRFLCMVRNDGLVESLSRLRGR